MFEKTENNDKKAGVGPFKKILIRFYLLGPLSLSPLPAIVGIIYAENIFIGSGPEFLIKFRLYFCGEVSSRTSEKWHFAVN